MKKNLPPEGKFYIYGIDPGGRIFGISEYSFEYRIGRDGGVSSNATLEEYYSIHMKDSWDSNQRIDYLFRFFREFPFREKYTQIAYIEEVPFVQNRKIVNTLHEYVGAIKAALLYKGFAVHTVFPGTWKLETVGKGTAKKADIMAWATGGNLPIDPETLEEDSLDALLIGFYGLKRITAQVGYDLKEQANKIKISRSLL